MRVSLLSDAGSGEVFAKACPSPAVALVILEDRAAVVADLQPGNHLVLLGQRLRRERPVREDLRQLGSVGAGDHPVELGGPLRRERRPDPLYRRRDLQQLPADDGGPRPGLIHRLAHDLAPLPRRRCLLHPARYVDRSTARQGAKSEAPDFGSSPARRAVFPRTPKT
ncbi:hypothetical protein GCM10010232_67960 [Streptomyces amakusaensis]